MSYINNVWEDILECFDELELAYQMDGPAGLILDALLSAIMAALILPFSLIHHIPLRNVRPDR